MADSFPYLAMAVVAMGMYVLIKSILATLASRIQMDLDRHRMLVEVQQRRKAYLNSLAQRQGLDAPNSSVIIEDH